MDTKLERPCSGVRNNLKSFSEKLRLELMRRVGIFEDFHNFLPMDVCKEHELLLSLDFHEKVARMRSCLWPSHGPSMRKARCNKSITMYEITIEMSKKMLDAGKKSKTNYFLPYGGLLCFEHKILADNIIKAASLPETPEKEDDRMEVDEQTSSSSNSSIHSEFQMTEDEEEEKDEESEKNLPALKKEAFDKLLSLYEFQPPLLNKNQTQFDILSRNTKYKVLKTLGMGIHCLLDNISGANDYIQIWSAAKNSSLIERMVLPAPAITDVLLEEAMHAYSCEPTRQGRRQILSMVVPHYSRSFLLSLNKNGSTNVSDEYELSDPEGEEQSELIALRRQRHWNPPLTEYAIRMAKLHFLEYERAFAPVVYTPKHNWHISDEQFEAIFGKLTIWTCPYT